MVIGTIQLLSVIANYSSGPFWDGVNSVGDHFDVIGGGICGGFVVFGAASVLLYKPWRRRYDRRSRVSLVESVKLQILDAKEMDEKKAGTSSLREEQACPVERINDGSEA